MNNRTGLQLVTLYLELGRIRIPWDLRVWKGKGSTSPMKLALRMLTGLPKVLTERYYVVVLADSWFASKDFIEGIHQRGYHAILGVRSDRTTTTGMPLTRLKRRGQQLMLKGLGIPVWISWFYLKVRDKPREKRFVLSTRPLSSSQMVREGRQRWRIEVFFKIIKHTFALSMGSQGTGLGVLRFLLLSLLTFVLVFALRPLPAPREVMPWSELAREAVEVFLPVVLVLALLTEIERRRSLLENLGMSIRISRYQRPVHKCKI